MGRQQRLEHATKELIWSKVKEELPQYELYMLWPVGQGDYQCNYKGAVFGE